MVNQRRFDDQDMVKTASSYEILIGKPEWKRRHGIPGVIWKDKRALPLCFDLF
jgi:hypothetical protein